MKGDDQVIAGSLKNKVQAVAGKVIPDTAKAECTAGWPNQDRASNPGRKPVSDLALAKRRSARRSGMLGLRHAIDRTSPGRARPRFRESQGH